MDDLPQYLRNHIEERLAAVKPICSELPDDRRGTTSTHEAGHAVVQICDGPGVAFIEGKVAAKTEPVGGVAAFVSETPHVALACSVAGGIAERLHCVPDVGIGTMDRALAAKALSRIAEIEGDPGSDVELVDAAFDSVLVALTQRDAAIHAIATGHGGRSAGTPWDGREIQRLAHEMCRQR